MTFLCYAVVYSPDNSFKCFRRRDNYERCSRQDRCRFVHFNGGEVKNKCNSGCITVAWSGYSVDFRNFTGKDYAEFSDGACDGSDVETTVSSSLTTADPTSEAQVPSTAPMLDGLRESEDASLIVIAAIGWALLALTILIIIISAFICRRAIAKKILEKEPILEKPPANPNAYHHIQSETHQEGSMRIQPVPGPTTDNYETPINAGPQDEPAYLELVAEEDDVYNVIEDEANERNLESKTNKGVNNGSLKVTPPIKGERNLSKNNGLGYANLTGKDKSLPSYENMNGHSETEVEKLQPEVSDASSKGQDEVTIDDYSRLQAGRSNIGPEVTDSFLATYNTATDEPEHNTARDETEEHEMVYPLEDDDDEENRNSGGYTVLEKEKEDSLFRDSASYTTVNREGSVKHQLEDKSIMTHDLESQADGNLPSESDRFRDISEKRRINQSDSNTEVDAHSYELVQPISEQ